MNINTIFDPDNVVWAFLLKLYYLAFAGLLWFLASLPIITIGAATVSLYSYCFNVLEGNEGYVVRTFFSTFKRVFLQATIVFLIIAAGLAFLVFDAWFFLQQIPMLFFVAISLMLLVLVGTVHVFPLLSRKQHSLKTLIISSCILGFRHLPVSITILVIAGLHTLSVYYAPVTIFFSAGLACALSTMFIRSLYIRIGV
ncbi:YesL family protein [uncultured Sphaerochaeta sp.]|uniref:YesL family protein n=1 Tax=uncultured Sphaerochaeta sp. TaxID=886478 RepID=UPI002A0A7948|nr:YesL family protein [uncultured Sphaerochaeta sp.]